MCPTVDIQVEDGFAIKTTPQTHISLNLTMFSVNYFVSWINQKFIQDYMIQNTATKHPIFAGLV